MFSLPHRQPAFARGDDQLAACCLTLQRTKKTDWRVLASAHVSTQAGSLRPLISRKSTIRQGFAPVNMKSYEAIKRRLLMTQPAARPTGRSRSTGRKSVTPASGQLDPEGASPTPRKPRKPAKRQQAQARCRGRRGARQPPRHHYPARRTADKDLPLREDIRFLGRLLGDCVREQEGDAAFDLVETIRQTAVRFRRENDRAAGTELDRLLKRLSRDQTNSVVRAFSYFSHLANIAEDQHHNRRRRVHALAGSPPQPGSLARALPSTPPA
jgi:phosphoenolpyruvate carboxylase